LGVIYHVPDTQTALRAKVARAFNAPALLWIYNSDPVFSVGPNLDLEAETAMVYEVGVHTTWGRSEWDVNLFQSEIDDALVTVLDAGTGMYIKDNVDHIRRRGVEVVAAYDINEMWRVYSSGRFVAAENTTTGRRVRDAGLARQAYTFGVNYQHEGWGAFLSGYYNRWSSSPSSRPNDRKPVFDLKLTRRLPWEASGIEGVAFINIHNLTDAKYWSEQVYPLARRYVEGGVTINF
jgi:outer membrane receptor protein involved in Fe transport